MPQPPIDPLEQAILDLLDQRQHDATICPSEAARRAYPETWRDHMEATRETARHLARGGHIRILQRGQTLDPATEFTGPIRLGKPAEEGS